MALPCTFWKWLLGIFCTFVSYKVKSVQRKRPRIFEHLTAKIQPLPKSRPKYLKEAKKETEVCS